MNTRANILYIMSDDHASNSISAYNSILASVFKTPHIDRIGTEGAIAYNCCCSNAICTPSRATIMTGVHSHINGVKTLDDELPPDAITFAQLMHDAGYTTAIVGKWHLHCEPKGFDYYDVLPAQGEYFDPIFLDSKTVWSDIPDTITNVAKKDAHLAQRYGTLNRGYISDIITDKSLDWLQHRDTTKPFMLCCHHKAPHDFFEYHPRDEHLFYDIEIPMPDSLFENKEHRSEGSKNFGTSVSEFNKRRNMVKTTSTKMYPHPPTSFEGLDDTEKTKRAYQVYLKDYLRTVKGIDDNVGRLLNYLENTGELDNTIIIYTSDQGMFLGEHDYIDKRWIYDEALKMPFLIRYPQKIPAGTKIESVLKNVDFAPTLLEFAGLKKTKMMQGKSFVKILQGNEEDWDNTLYYRYWMHMTHHDVPAHIGLRTKEYKLMYFYGEALGAKGALDKPTPKGWELYDLINDPYELHNVFEHTEYADIQKSLIEKLKQEKARVGDIDNVLDNY